MQKIDVPDCMVGIKILNETYLADETNPVYVQIAHIGHLNQEKYTNIVTALVAINKLRPIEFKIGASEWINYKRHDFSGRRVSIENQYILEKLIDFYTTYNEHHQSVLKKYEIPSWCILFRGFKLQRELLIKEKENTTMIGGAFFIKQIGKDVPIIELN